MTLAHLGLGLFVMGACFETAWKAEGSQALAVGERMSLGGYVVRLEQVGDANGSNYDATRAVISIARKGVRQCEAAPERRFYPANAQSTSEVAICQRGLDDLYIVLGEARPGPDGLIRWVVRAYVNPWARLIFFGPLIMALGGLVSLADRRLRFAPPRRAAVPLAVEPAE